MNKIIILMLIAVLFPMWSVCAFDKNTLAEMNKGILMLSENIEDCTPYEAEFNHPFTGEKLTRKIVGMVADECTYVEAMPKGGKMECNFPKSTLPSIAAFYQASANADSIEANVSTSISDSGNESKSTYKINGKEVDNPLQESLDSGICIISGY